MAKSGSSTMRSGEEKAINVRMSTSSDGMVMVEFGDEFDMVVTTAHARLIATALLDTADRADAAAAATLAGGWTGEGGVQA